MYHVLNVEEKYKLEKQKEEEITIFVRIILHLVIISHGINQKKVKSGIQKKHKNLIAQKKQRKKLQKKHQVKINSGNVNV